MNLLLKKKLFILLVVLSCTSNQFILAQPTHTTTETRLNWWREARFGLFIHWGLYSELGGVWKGQPVRAGYSEQIQSFAKIPKVEYEAVAKVFDPEKWNADSVVALAKAAGMKSIVFTSKHHDGFCMYHSKYTKYNVVDATPFKRDVMKELSDACRRQGVKFAVIDSCFASSRCMLNWHPQYCWL